MTADFDICETWTFGLATSFHLQPLFVARCSKKKALYILLD